VNALRLEVREHCSREYGVCRSTTSFLGSGMHIFVAVVRVYLKVSVFYM
jgi:hypothetical protein